MCNLDENCEETIEERLREYQRQGTVGIGEFMICRKINHPFVQAVFQAAEKLGMPILFHMSPQEGYEYGIVDNAGLPLLEESLKKYPNLKFIGHSQPFWHEISGDASGDLSSRMEWGKGEVAPGGRLLTFSIPTQTCTETYPPTAAAAQSCETRPSVFLSLRNTVTA